MVWGKPGGKTSSTNIQISGYTRTDNAKVRDGKERERKFIESLRRKIIHSVWDVVCWMCLSAICGKGSVRLCIGNGWLVVNEEMALEGNEG